MNAKKYQLSFTSEDSVSLIKEKIKQANTNIDIEAYYFLEDNIGREILDLLIYKSIQGIKIRILLDHVGSYDFSNSKTIKKINTEFKNINIRFFNSIFPFSKHKKSFWFFRNHRRSIIIDDKYIFTGSFCFGESTKNWLEMTIFIEDLALNTKMKKVFNKTWSKTPSPTFRIGSVNKKDLNIINPFTYLTQSPLQFQRYIYKYYLKSIKDSQKSIILSSPYFILNKRFLKHLKKASGRGVNIDIIIPEKTDWTIVDLARNIYIKYLLKHNINIYFHNKMTHGKFAIFDNNEAFIGTMNLDNLGLKYNYECGIKITDIECIQDLLLYIEKDLLINSQKIILEDWNNSRNFITKVLEKIVWIFRKLL